MHIDENITLGNLDLNKLLNSKYFFFIIKKYNNPALIHDDMEVAIGIILNPIFSKKNYTNYYIKNNRNNRNIKRNFSFVPSKKEA